MSVSVGIDLGTSNSCIAAVVNGEPTVLTDPAGRRTQPSVVAFGYGGAVVVGPRARQQLAFAPENTVYSVKRLIGRKATRACACKARPTPPRRSARTCCAT